MKPQGGIMKRYETIVIIDPDLSKETEAPVLERVNDLIPQYKGVLIETDDWGIKKLAYEIKKKNRGHYVRLDFCGDGALVQEMERFFRIDDKIMKFMTVLLDEDADLETIQAEMAKKEAEAEPSPAPETEETVETQKDEEAEEADTQSQEAEKAPEEAAAEASTEEDKPNQAEKEE